MRLGKKGLTSFSDFALNWSDIVFCKSNKRDSCLMNVKYVVSLMLRNESKVKVR